MTDLSAFPVTRKWPAKQPDLLSSIQGDGIAAVHGSAGEFMWAGYAGTKPGAGILPKADEEPRRPGDRGLTEAPTGQPAEPYIWRNRPA